MKIALAQINTTVSALEGNTNRVIKAIAEARQLGADLVIFNEMVLTGYPPKDLFEREEFVQANLDMLDRVRAASSSIGVIVGYVEKNPGPEGKNLFNAATFIEEGKIVSRHYKTLLPTYDVFDEARYFEPAKELKVDTFRGLRLGISICEDVWNDKQFWKRRLYPRDPIKELSDLGVDMLINVSASPYSLGKRSVKADMLRTIAMRYRRPLLYVNQVGGNDHLVFDGASVAYGPDGRVIAQARDFAEDMVVVNTENWSGELHPIAGDELEEAYRALLLGIHDYVRKCGFRRVVIGLSGGIDSALTAVLATHALGKENVVGITMPSRYSSERSKDDARLLAEKLGIEFQTVPIEPIFRSYLETLEPVFAGRKPDVTEENIQARIRGNILMGYSNKFGALVLGTGNKSELAVGYCTLYGDMSGGLTAISDVYKTMVYRLARWINRNREVIPQTTIEKPPSAELKADQRDTDSLPPYEVLDPILKAYIEDGLAAKQITSQGHELELVRRVIRMVDGSEYKRQQAPPGIKISGKAFGTGRRMPIARGSLTDCD
jgi:NAD+ synthase (glutamine-hydrolysing)